MYTVLSFLAYISLFFNTWLASLLESLVLLELPSCLELLGVLKLLGLLLLVGVLGFSELLGLLPVAVTAGRNIRLAVNFIPSWF